MAPAPDNATYIVQTANATLTAEQILADLTTGILKSTTGTGVVSIATQGTDYYAPGGTDVAVADGGTGASDAATARTNLGLGSIATQSSSNVSITGGSVSGITDLAIADGGTGTSSLPTGLLIGAGTSAITATSFTDWTNYTPDITMSGDGLGEPNYTNILGRYCRIGNVVFVEVSLNGDTDPDGSGANQIRVSLPITPSSANVYATYFVPCGVAANSTTEWQLTGLVDAPGSLIKLNKWQSATATNALTGGDQGNGARFIRLKFFYEV